MSAIAVVCLLACVPNFDTTRESRDDPSTGAAIYREMCDRVAVADDPSEVAGNPVCTQNAPPTATDSPRLQALYAQRERLIDESNTALAAPVGGNVRQMLANALPLYDAGIMQAATGALGDWLAELQTDTNALSALENIARRQGYILPSLTPGLMRVMMRFDGSGDLIESGLAPITTTTAGTVQLANAMSILQPELKHAFDEPDDPTHTWFLVRNFLMTPDPALNLGTARYIVQRGTNGLALPASLIGQVSGTPFPLGDPNRAEKRDTFGRLLDTSGNLVFRYTNTEGTVLAGLIRESARIAKTAPGAIGQLARPVASLLGPPTARSFAYPEGTIRFGGFDTTKSPLLDAVYALAVIAKRPEASPALEALRQLAAQDEAALAGTTHAVAVAMAMLRQAPYKDYALEDDTTMAEDFMGILAKILREPGLAEDLMTVIQTNPDIQGLSQNMTDYMTYLDRIDYNPSDINGPPIGTMHTQVDRTKPDLTNNRSLFQRFIHLLYDARGAKLCNKQDAVITFGPVTYPFSGGYDECALTEIDDLAIFHAESIIGQAVVTLKDALLADIATSSLIAYQSGIDDFGFNPTAKSLDRFVFAPWNTYLSNIYNPVPGHDGTPLKDRHNGTIFCWELEDFYSHMAPIIQAFYNHGRTDLFVDLLATVHLHYGSRDSDFTQSKNPNALLYAPDTGIVRFEPVLAKAISTNPFAGIARAMNTLQSINVNGVDGRARVLALLRALILPESNVGLTTRDGHAYVRNDGVTVTQLTPVHILVDAFRGMDRALKKDPDAYDALGDGLKGTIAGLLDGNGTSMASNDTAPLTADIIKFVNDRIQAHIAAGDLGPWADSLPDAFQEVLDQPLVQTLAPLGSMFMSDPAARAQVDALIIHLADQSKDVNAYTSTIQALADGMQLLDDEKNLHALAVSLSAAADPKNGMLMRGAIMLQAMASKDTGRAMAQLLANLATHPDSDLNNETPIEGMFDIMMEVNRLQPGAGTHRTKDDYAHTIGVMRDFLSDPERGLQRLYEIIANR